MNATGDLLFNCTFEGTGTKASQIVTACGAQQWTVDNSATIVAGALCLVAFEYSSATVEGKAVQVLFARLGNRRCDAVSTGERILLAQEIAGVVVRIEGTIAIGVGESND